MARHWGRNCGLFHGSGKSSQAVSDATIELLAEMTAGRAASLASRLQLCGYCAWRPENTSWFPSIVEEARQEQADVVIISRGTIGESFGRLRTHAFGIVQRSPCPVLRV